MKKLIAALFLMTLATPLHSAIAFVQSTHSYATTSEGVSGSTFNANPTVGNLVVAWCTASNNVDISMDGWNPLTSAAGGSGASQRSGRMFWRIVVASHPAWGSINPGGNAARIFEMAEFSGIDATQAFVAEGAQLAASATSYLTPVVTPASGFNALVLTSYMIRKNSDWTNEYLNGDITSTEIEDTFISSLNQSAMAYNDIASTSGGNYMGYGDNGGTGVGVAAIAIFRASTGGGGGEGDAPDEVIHRIPQQPIIQ